MKKMLFSSFAFSLVLMLVVLFSISLKASATEKVAPEVKNEVLEHSNVLKGLVFDKLTQETLAGAVITANGQKVYTDLDGNFSITNLCGEKCQLKVSLISYVDQTIEVDTQNAKPLQIKLQQR